MKDVEKNPDKELYKELRVLSCQQLWTEEVPRFDGASPRERLARVGLVRAVGVVFSESGTEEQKRLVRPWLHRLLQDPVEKIRRYAMTALPKLGAGPEDEAQLLSLMRATTVEREKKFLGETLAKIGGSETLRHLQATSALTLTQQKVKANVARSEQPSVVRLHRMFSDVQGLKINLRGRSGLEQVVRQEVEESAKFRVAEVQPGLVVATPEVPFSLAELYAFRCFGTAGFVLGTAQDGDKPDLLASLISSPLARRLLSTFTEGAMRYRLNFVGKGHQRGTVREVAARAYALDPEILNDATAAPWAIDVHPAGGGRLSVELRPRLHPDPRLKYRQEDVPAASHPPLAACMARLSAQPSDVVWDPFCGSGLELIEKGILGGVRRIYGTDVSAEAIAIARRNFAAAKLPGVEATFSCADFRGFENIRGLGRERVDVIITNPPMGKRVPIRDLRQLIENLLAVAAFALVSGGRLVFVNPLRIETKERALELKLRQTVDFGGFYCQLEMYRKRSGR